ncbi:MAG TPA: hypothetical protein DD490_21645 [Acidobacteria bacterium]|nr:hypothetical protein [Acidobacteriota bacterium]
MADRTRLFVLLFSLLGLCGISSARAASTGTTALHRPQGSGAGTANGDYITASAGGLSTSYRYFIEVPSGVTRLTVEIFDADIGIGGSAEATAGRDRDRGGFDTTATYSLLDPSGTAQTVRFTTGDTANPTGGDNAWLTLYDATANTVRDNFGTAAYSNNDGNNNWAGNWIETDSGGAGATAGALQITGGELRLQDGVSGSPSLEREADLSGSPGLSLTTAFFTFDYRTSNNLEDGDQISVQVSANGGGSWTTLETFSNDSSGSRSYDITGSIANNTRVRFLLSGGYTGTELFFVDNLQITDGVKTAGHWELRVSQATGTTIDDINALGIRAHDGTSGSGGTELNVYYDSHASFGANPPASGTNSQSYTVYPYITSGCTASKNDFDFDSGSGTVGSLDLASRTAAFAQSYASASMSANNAWARNTWSGWTTDKVAGDYGIWEADLTIISYLVSGTPNGNYGHLSFTNFNAAANPPAANPTTDAFRVYLANDAGTAPSKPYVEQLLTQKSGPNPVPVGGTARFQVTVRVVNPGAEAVTFSNANVVTANIPGSGAVYAGNAAVGQGSILSQPSVGGTGNITWSPGTLAAGATTILTYQVDITPTSAGQRIPATATPASGDGTRAQFLDNTGNTSQARATYLFGPLCELAVTQGEVITRAVVSSFRALPGRQGGVLAEWTTASEEATAGFRLLRRNPQNGRLTPVHEGLLAALPAAPQGGIYRLLDEGASPREAQAYVVEEVEAGGRRRRYGPFRVTPWDATVDAPEMAGTFERRAHPGRRTDDPEPPAMAAQETGRRSSAAHVSVVGGGLIRLSAASLAAATGRSLDRVERQIGNGQIVISRDGLPVAWHPERRKDGSAAALLFLGEAADSLYSTAAVYKLDLDAANGTLLATGLVAGTPGGSPKNTFPERQRTEQDRLPATAIALDPASDYWFWEFLQGGDATFGVRTFSLDAPGVEPTGAAELAVDLHGATTTGTLGEHRVEVRLNGVFLGETQWQGIGSQRALFAVPAGTLHAAGNQVELTARLGNGAPYSFTYVEGFDLAWRRSFQAEGESLTFAPDGAGGVTVAGFASPDIWLLDIGDPRNPRRLAGATVAADSPTGWRLSFVADPGTRYLAAGSTAIREPAAIRAWTGVPKVRADHLVLAPTAWRAAAERLAELRRGQGLRAQVVTLEEIADAYGHGVATPQAIRAFLAAAWRTARPRYVALAGRGTIDYRNLLGYGDNRMPPLLVQSTGGLFPSDNRLADVDGDGLPEMAVGRIPVLSAEELDAWIDKLIAYETGAPAGWTRKLLLLSDSPDPARTFAADSGALTAQLPAGFQPHTIDLGSEPLATARGRLFAELAAGAGWINYFGHGGLDRLSAGGLLTGADVTGLTHGDRLPVLTAMTCTVNRFTVPGVASLGELLVKSPAGGAVAVLGPSGLADGAASRDLAKILYRRTPELARSRLGDLILRAYTELRAQGGDVKLLDLYNLLGDPALRLRTAPDVPAGGAGSGE